MSAAIRAVLLLLVSNTFMTFAWYAHLRNLGHKPWFVAVLASWSIALFEYIFQVPANRIGYTVLSLSQLKIIQEVITLSVFVPFAIFYMRQSWTWNYLWAALCLLAAVFFMFREPIQPAECGTSGARF
ncbi:MAG: DMT family protein [Kiritimatiellia bacterium]